MKVGEERKETDKGYLSSGDDGANMTKILVDRYKDLLDLSDIDIDIFA